MASIQPAKALLFAAVIGLGLSGGLAAAAILPNGGSDLASQIWDNTVGRGMQNGPGAKSSVFATAASYIGITQAQLRTELGTDKSLADVAIAHGKTRDGLIQALLAAQQQEIATLVDRKGIGARPSPGPGRPGIGPVPGFRTGEDPLAAAATYLGTTTADLQTKLRAGQTLASIANATPGKSRDGLVAALTTASTTAIDKAFADKKLTQEQADKAKAGLSKHITEFVDHVYTKVERKPVAPKVEMFIGDAVSVARDYLGVPATDLGTALRSGKSLGEIADSIPGKNRQGLINAMTAAANAKINKAAAENKITAEQAATLNANVVAAVTKLVDRKMTATTTGKKPGR